VPAIVNAVEDSLADRDVAIERVPLTAASVWPPGGPQSAGYAISTLTAWITFQR